MIGPRRKAPPVNMPENFKPPYDAFEPRFKATDHLILVIFGVEVRRTGGAPERQAIESRLHQKEDGPLIIEHGVVKDGFGPKSYVWFAYWSNEASYKTWCEKSKIDEIFGDSKLLQGDVGLWREYCKISLDHNETSYSREENVSGIANLCDSVEVTPIHAYWGSARDRMVAAADNDLVATGHYTATKFRESIGKRLKVKAPTNVCMIKTTQDFSLINDEQLAIYHTDVEPAFNRGLQYLRDNPVDSGCIGMRFIEEANSTGVTGKRTLGLGFFESLGALEEWTHNHPTHIDIMKTFGSMVEKFQGQPGLHLWHEVTVFTEGNLYGEYVNCSADGTLLQVTV